MSLPPDPRGQLRDTSYVCSGFLARFNRLNYDSDRMKVRDVVTLIEKDGWLFQNQEGSHRHYKHPVKPGKVTVSGHLGKDVAPGTLNSVMKQAGIK